MDRSIFSIFCQFGDALEATVDPRMTETDVIQWIAEGQYGEIAFVTEHNPVESSAADVTEAMAEEVVAYAEREGVSLPESVFAFCERHHAVPLWAAGLQNGRLVEIGELV